jgi:hypothetical protein
MARHTFELPDRDGKTHSYIVDPHPGGPGAALALRIQGLTLEPVAEAVRTIASIPSIQQLGTALREGGEAPDSTQVIGDVLGAVREVDMTALGRSLGSVLSHPGGPELIRAILERTARDGRRLSEPAYFDAAYERNYGEMLRAVVEVVQFNGFFPLAELFSGIASVEKPEEAKASSPAPSSPRARRSGRLASPS